MAVRWYSGYKRASLFTSCLGREEVSSLFTSFLGRERVSSLFTSCLGREDISYLFTSSFGREGVSYLFTSCFGRKEVGNLFTSCLVRGKLVTRSEAVSCEIHQKCLIQHGLTSALVHVRHLANQISRYLLVGDYHDYGGETQVHRLTYHLHSY